MILIISLHSLKGFWCFSVNAVDPQEAPFSTFRIKKVCSLFATKVISKYVRDNHMGARV